MTTIKTFDIRRTCSGCQCSGTIREDVHGFMLDKEGEWWCETCYTGVRDKYRGARQPEDEDECAHPKQRGGGKDASSCDPSKCCQDCE